MKALKLYENAHLFYLQGEGYPRPSTKTRTSIQTFSSKSRKRLLLVCNKVNTKAIYGKPIFCTLTYPEHFPVLHSVYKRDLHVFFKKFIRRFPKAVIIWRLEYQERQAPHYHLLVFNTDKSAWFPGIHKFRSILAVQWNKTVAPNNPAHLSAGTEASLIKSWRGVTHYVSKYMAKVDQSKCSALGMDSPGRFWGIYNRSLLPIDEIEVELSREEFHYLRRVARAILQRKMKRKVYFYGAHSGIMLYIDYDTALSILDAAKTNCLPDSEFRSIAEILA